MVKIYVFIGTRIDRKYYYNHDRRIFIKRFLCVRQIALICSVYSLSAFTFVELTSVFRLSDDDIIFF